jgi:hypothetical protein
MKAIPNLCWLESCSKTKTGLLVIGVPRPPNVIKLLAIMTLMREERCGATLTLTKRTCFNCAKYGAGFNGSLVRESSNRKENGFGDTSNISISFMMNVGCRNSAGSKAQSFAIEAGSSTDRNCSTYFAGGLSGSLDTTILQTPRYVKAVNSNDNAIVEQTSNAQVFSRTQSTQVFCVLSRRGILR